MQFEHRSRLFDIEGVSQTDHIYRRIAASNNFYELDLLEYIYDLKGYILSSGCKNVIVDVGANIGNHSIFFSAFLADHLVAVEPNPDVLPVLRKNLSRNIDSYTLCEHAVGEREGTGSIKVPDNMGENIGAAQLDHQAIDGDIEIVTLDSVLTSLKDCKSDSLSVALIKIDVEGMEPQVLGGALETIGKHRPHIFVEAATKEGLNQILSYLEPLGYQRLPGRWAGTPVYHFAFKPKLALVVQAVLLQIRKRLRKLKKSLSKRLHWAR